MLHVPHPLVTLTATPPGIQSSFFFVVALLASELECRDF